MTVSAVMPNAVHGDRGQGWPYLVHAALIALSELTNEL